jgi:hypothetical protein
MRITSFFAIFLGVLMLPQVNASTFGAATDFSSSNPSGTWTYGSGITGTSFSAFTVFSAQSCPIGQVSAAAFACWQPAVTVNGDPVIGIDTSAGTLNIGNSNNIVLPPGLLLMHPGPTTDAIVEWIAPSAGVYDISGFFELLDTHPTGVTAEIFQGAEQRFSDTLTGPGAPAPATAGQRQNFDIAAILSAGDVISFGVNDDGNILEDSTGFDATISFVSSNMPEPSSVRLTIASLIGLCVLAFRRRKSEAGN